MEKVKDKLKDKYGKINKKALLAAIGLMVMSWAALPIIYWLIVRRKKGDEKKKHTENVEAEERENAPSPLDA
jgi:uncharacterized membrane protein YbhN (UPF0104 family)